MSDMINGGCLCGKVTYEVENKFEHLFFCHCEQCRKITSSAHASNLFRNVETFRWLKGEDAVKIYNFPNRGFSTAFCTQCGSGLPFINSSGKKVIVPAGSLDGEPVLTSKPEFSVANRHNGITQAMQHNPLKNSPNEPLHPPYAVHLDTNTRRP